MPDRTADQIQGDIVAARAALARTVDELAYRTSPKRVLGRTKQSLREKARTPQGQAVIAGASALLLVVLVRRFRKR